MDFEDVFAARPGIAFARASRRDPGDHPRWRVQLV